MVPRSRDFEDLDNFVEVRDIDIDDQRFDMIDVSDEIEFVDPVEIEDFDD